MMPAERSYEDLTRMDRRYAVILYMTVRSGGTHLMNQDIHIHVSLTARQFRSYCAFDTFRVRRRHMPILIISAILFTLGFADLLFSKGSSGTVAGLLIGLGIAVPMVVFGLYVIQIESQVSRQGLSSAQEMYALHLGHADVQISGLHRSAGSVRIPWYEFWAAYRAKGAVYLYASEQRAFILPDGQASVSDDQLWDYLCSHMGTQRCFEAGGRHGKS